MLASTSGTNMTVMVDFNMPMSWEAMGICGDSHKGWRAP